MLGQLFWTNAEVRYSFQIHFNLGSYTLKKNIRVPYCFILCYRQNLEIYCRIKNLMLTSSSAMRNSKRHSSGSDKRCFWVFGYSELLPMSSHTLFTLDQGDEGKVDEYQNNFYGLRRIFLLVLSPLLLYIFFIFVL